MIQFLEIFDEKIYNQYFLLGIAVLVVIFIKIWMAGKAYQRKLVSFIHPDSMLSQIKKKVKSVQDAQNLFAFNILKLPEDDSRIRNIAFLMALLKSYGVPLKPLKAKLSETFAKLNKDNLSKANKTYKQWIFNEIEQDSNGKQKKQKPFYTV